MRHDATARRRAVLGVLAATAVLAPAAGYAGHAVGTALRSPEPTAVPAAVAAPTATASPSASPSTSPSPTALPATLSGEALAAVSRATVRLSAGMPGSRSVTGSGTVISPDGLVLTNAHVAQPRAPGRAVVRGEPAEQLRPDPPFLVVWVNPPGDGPAVPTYRASVLAADGYLDFAVLRIDADLDGRPLPAGTRFPSLARGSAQEVQKNDRLTVLGFPGLTGGERLDVTEGSIRNLLPDPGGRVPGDRYWLATTVDFAAGNSGGAAVDNAGRLVGVPSSRFTNERLETTGIVRAVDLAEPLIAAAENRTPYRSPFVVPATGRERGEDLGWSATPLDCPQQEGSDVLPVGDGSVWSHVSLSGMATGEDLLVQVSDGADVIYSEPSRWDGGPDGACLVTEIPAGDLPPGDYELRVFVGPTYEELVSSPLEVFASD